MGKGAREGGDIGREGMIEGGIKGRKKEEQGDKIMLRKRKIEGG